MITEALRLLITADSAGAVRGIEQVGKTADRELSRSERSLDKWGARLTSVGSGLIAFGAVAAYGLGQAAQSAGELEQAVGGTEAVFGKATATIDDYASNAAEKVGLSETAFRTATTSIGGQLKRMGVDVDTAAAKSIELTETAADLAATYGGTTAEAVEALGSAFRGEADPAERFNLDLKVSKVNAEAVALGLATSTSAVDDHARAQAILSLVTKQSADAQGQFAREGDTLAHQQQVLAAQFEDLKASIGEGAIPVMKTLADVTSTVVGGMSDANAATGGFLGQAATVATVASLAVGGLSIMVGQAMKMHSQFSAARTAVSDFAGAGGLGRLGRTLARGGLVIGGLYLLEEALDAALGDQAPDAANLGQLEAGLVRFGTSGRLTGEAVDVLGGNFENLKGALEDIDLSGVENARASVDRFASSIPGAGRLLSTGFAKDVDESKQALADFDQALASIAAADPEAAFNVLSAAADAAGVDVEDLLPHLEEYQSATGRIEASSSLAGGKVDEFGRSMEGAAGSTDNATTALQTYQDQLQALFDPLFGAVTAAHNLRDANQEVADKTVALAEAEAQYGVGSAEATAAAIALSDAQTAASMAAADQESALLTLKGAVQDGTTSVDAAKQKLAEWVAQGVITQESADATARELDGVAWSMGAIPDGKSIDIHVTGTQYTIGQLDAIAERVNALSGGSFHISRGGGGGQTFHTGGIVPGPRGQEVDVTVLAGERVLSLAEVDRMSGAGRMMPAAMMGHTFQGQAAQTGGPQGVTIQQVVVNTSDSPRQWLDEIPWRLAS